MWLANFVDGSSVSSKSTFWTQLPKEKKISGLQLSHPHFAKLFLNLAGMDKYYFLAEAIALIPQNGAGSTPSVVAEVIGGHDIELGVGIEIRLDYTGNVRVRHYAIPLYRYSQEILFDGAVSQRGKVTVAEVGSVAR